MHRLYLALLNVARNRRRTVMATATIAVGVVALVLISGFVSTIRYALYTQIVRAEGHVQIMAAHYLDLGQANPGQFHVTDWQAIAAELRADPALGPTIAEIAPMLQLAGVAGHAPVGASRSFAGAGLDPEAFARMQAWDDFGLQLARATLELDPTRPDEVLVGLGLARQLQICAGLIPAVPGCTDYDLRAAAPEGPVVAEIAELGALAATEAETRAQDAHAGQPAIDLMVAGAEGAPNAATVWVRGASEQARRQSDNAFVAMTLPAAQALAYDGADRVSQVMVQFHHAADAPAGLARIRTLLAGRGYDVLPMEEVNDTFSRVVAMFRIIQLFIGAVVGLIILFMVANTMAMVVVERTAEIGTLRALGESRPGVMALFLGEGVALGVLSASVGMGLAWAAVSVLNALGLSFVTPTSTAPVPIRILFLETPGVIAAIWALIVAVAALSSILPARRAARTEIVTALRFA